MTQMNRINELIQQHCPNGVSFVPLGSLGKRNKGTAITATRMKLLAQETGPVRIFAGGQTMADVREDVIPEEHIVRVPSIIVKSRGHIGFSYYDQPFTHKSEIWSYSISPGKVNQKFVFYFLLTQTHKLQEIARATSVKLPQLSVRHTDSLPIPVPPLVVQEEIVRILDTFTQLEAELEAELEARRRQYEHYRSVITQGDGSARLSALGDHIDFGGRNVAPDRMPETTVSIYSLPAFDRGIGPELTTPADVGSAKSRVAEPSLLVAKLNPHIPRVWRVDAPDEGAYASPEFYQLIPKDNLSLEYLEHLVGASMSKLAGMVTGSTNSHKRLQREHIASLMVRIPSLREQAEASALLTRLHNLVNDLSVGLPAELAARRKQYEYYRDRLLSFEELRS